MGYKVARLVLSLIAVSLTANAQTNLSAQSQKQSAATTATWTNATTVDSVASLATTGYSVVVVSFVPTGSITGGTVNFEVSDDGSTWFPVVGTRFDISTVESTFALSGATKKIWQFAVGGTTSFRVRLNPVITGTGSVAIRATGQAGAGNLSSAIANSLSVSASSNVAQLNGTTIDTNSGSKSAGTQRMVLATDQPQLTNALKVDGSATTQPVSGTVTANIGTSGSLALDASVTGLEVGQASTTSGQKGILNLGAVTTAAPSYTTAQSNPLSLTTAGALRTDSSATTQPVSGTVTANAGSGTFTVSGTVTANAGSGTLSTNVAQVAGSTASTVATGVQKVGIADSGGTALLSAANALNSTGGGVLATQAVGQFDDTSPTTITENQFGNLRMSNNRNLYGTIRDAAGNERGVNVNASNQLTVSVDNGGVGSGSSDSGNPVKIGGRYNSTPIALTNGQRGDLQMDTAGDTLVSLGTRLDATNDAVTASNVTGNVASAATDSGNPVKVGAKYNSAGVTVTDGQRVDLQSDVNGQLKVTMRNFIANSTDLQSGAGANANGNALGTSGHGTAFLTVRCTSCSGGTTVFFEVTEDDTNWSSVLALKVGTTTLATSYAPSGTEKTYWQIPVSGSTNIRARIGSYSAGTIDVSGHVIPIAAPVVASAATLSGGTAAVDSTASTYWFVTTGTSPAHANVKASAGNIYGIRVGSSSATLMYLHLFNLATDPTCSSSTGHVETIVIPASTAGTSVSFAQPAGQAFSTGIGYCISGGAAAGDNTNGAAGANITILYK